MTVKIVGMRRISEIGKGAYMIGSSGWAYHHKNPKYDRKDVVVTYVFYLGIWVQWRGKDIYTGWYRESISRVF